MAAVAQGLDPWFVNQAVSPQEARAFMAAVMGHNASGVGSEGGIVLNASNRLLVSATTPSASMAVTVSAGSCVIPRTNEYAYICTLPATVTVDIGAANATNPRIDTVVARVRDSDLGDASNGVWSKGFGIEVVAGTPAAVPAAPDLSAIPGVLPLADVFVNSAPNMPIPAAVVSGNITSRRMFTRAAGGIRYSDGDGGRGGAYPWDVRVSAGGQYDGWDPNGLWVPMFTARNPTTYTPTWTMDNLGTGSASTGVYTKTGRRVDFEAVLVAGTGVSLGTGAVTFTLPVPSANRSSTAASLMAWSRGAFIYSSSLWRSVDIVIGNNVTTGTVFARNTTDGFVNPGLAPTPYSFAAGNSITVSGRYWAAS